MQSPLIDVEELASLLAAEQRTLRDVRYRLG